MAFARARVHRRSRRARDVAVAATGVASSRDPSLDRPIGIFGHAACVSDCMRVDGRDTRSRSPPSPSNRRARDRGDARARMRAVARAVAATTVAVTAVTAIEAAALTATYVTAPEARGPRRGLARYDDGVDRADARGRARRRRLVAYVAGDSTACGVGCGDGAARTRARRGTTEEGPTLARAFARTLGERMTADVEWRALGFKGADVRGLRDKLVPALREAMEATRGEGGAGGDDDDASEEDAGERRASVDAVVIMCGLNDVKHSIVGRRSDDVSTSS